jgi:alginate O-acetyltransferase complex protein AlgI
MVFSSFIFLFIFLPVVCIAYFTLPKRFNNVVLLLSSLFFYAWGAPKMVVPLVLSCSFDYVMGTLIAPGGARSDVARKRYLTMALAANVLLLAYFKYMNFFVGELNRLVSAAGIAPLTWTEILLPIGISFFTFHKISYLVDVYRGIVKQAGRLTDYILYVVLFPQLVAGPIIRYADVAEEISSRKVSQDLFLAGAFRFVVGLSKKVLIADAMGTVADAVFAIQTPALTTGWAWIGALAYTFQIYFDFSGYSDMAIGLGWIFGFHFKENFLRPYLSHTITEFWRRWHISLSNFMREYVYIPLGGSRGSSVRTYRNLWLVFLISGLWHGAAWNFVVWGVYHGFFIVSDRLFWGKVSAKLPSAFNILFTFTIVVFGWVLFRADSLSAAIEFIRRMLALDGPSAVLTVPAAELLDHRSGIVMCLAAILCFVARIKSEPIPCVFPQSLRGVLGYGAAMVLLLFLSTAFLAARGFAPFLYFRF